MTRISDEGATTAHDARWNKSDGVFAISTDCFSESVAVTAVAREPGGGLTP